MAREKKRVTLHNGRTGNKGAYRPDHNDRQFNVTRSDHIDVERSNLNVYWSIYENELPGLTFNETEAEFYNRHFSDKLETMNAKAIASRHRERVKTMDDYRSSKKTCPEEVDFQVGSVKSGTVDGETLLELMQEQIRWEKEHYPSVQYLDVAVHMDETTPHIHARRVWIAHEDGMEVVNQTKALEEMGVQLHNPNMEKGQYNNRKMTHTEECRAHMQQLCMDRGIELELKPRHPSKSGLSLLEFKAREEQEKLEAAKAEAERLAQEQQRIGLEVVAPRRQQDEAVKAATDATEAEAEARRIKVERELQKEENRLSIYRKTEDGGEPYDLERLKEIKEHRKYSLTGDKVTMPKEDYEYLYKHAYHDAKADYTRQGIQGVRTEQLKAEAVREAERKLEAVKDEIGSIESLAQENAKLRDEVATLKPYKRFVEESGFKAAFEAFKVKVSEITRKVQHTMKMDR